MFKFKNLVIFIVSFAFLNPLASFADVAGLTPCKESTTFTKRRDASVRKLETRIKKYEAGSLSSLALEQQVERTKARFERYGESDLLCGKDGLPHLISDGRWTHANEFVLPGLLFLYITGWIGWVGRKYVRVVADSNNPTEKEIIIDVPLATKIMSTGFMWPFLAWQEYISGDLLASTSEVTVSPR